MNQRNIFAELKRRNVYKVAVATQRFKSAPADLRQIAQQLGVMHILEGSVQKSADQVRVNVQLINALTQAHLWAETYDRKLTDIFVLESDIAKTIADTLQAKLTGSEKKLLSIQPTSDPQAHELYLKGWFFWNKRTAGDLWKAIDYYNQAIAKDPNYALAYAGLADAYTVSFFWANVPATECYPKARAAAQRALEIDDTLAEAHTALAYPTFIFGWEFATAEREFRRAIALNPNYATAHQWYGECLSALGRHDDALAEIRRAQELDPLSTMHNSLVGLILVRARRYDEAIEQLRKAVAMDQNFAPTYDFLKWAYEDKGLFEEAATAYGNYLVLSGDLSREAAERRVAAIKDAYRRSGARGYWQKRLELWVEDRQRHYVDPYEAARFAARLGDKEQAVAWLEKGYEERIEGMAYLKVEPDFDDLRSDPRYADLLRRMGLRP